MSERNAEIAPKVPAVRAQRIIPSVADRCYKCSSTITVKLNQKGRKQCKACKKNQRKEYAAKLPSKAKSPEERSVMEAARILKIREAFAKKKQDGEKRKVSKSTRRKIGDAYCKTPMREKAIETMKSHPSNKAGPEHKRAQRWKLRSPNRAQIFEFSSLEFFIKTHPHLFDPDDLIPSQKGKRSRASVGLGSLSPRLSKTTGSWKGWQWVSTIERQVGNNDLLGQDSSRSSNRP